MQAAPVVPAAASRGSKHNELSVQDRGSSIPFRGDPITSLLEVVDSKLPMLIKENSCQHDELNV